MSLLSNAIVPTNLAKQRLTPRRLDVLCAIAMGDSTPETAKRLKINRFTVEGHIRCVYQYFNVHHKAAALSVALRLGYLKVVKEDETAFNKYGLPRMKDTTCQSQ